MKVAIGLWRNMRNEISIMDHSFVVDLRAKPARKLTVSHSWLSEGHQSCHSSEVVLDIRQSKHSQSASQTMSSQVNLGISMQCLQSLDLRNNSRLDCVVASLEAIVDLAVSAPRICDLIEGQIDDPICYVAASPKRKDDGVEIGRISGETLDVSGRVGEGLRVLKHILTTSSTVPSVDASYALIGD